ncbi:MAG: T9SS type A sorting domain-containing protein, partial [Ignavibacteria bacterium]|nr:T9SS type A sorting domain-containing protein [Ignavibacteria bacterium]
PGYNEVFSPYSSPNSNTWTTNPSNQNSGIFIWYYNYTGDSPPNLAYMKIYKAGSGGFSEDSILHLTPPSRPMNIVVDYYLETEDIMRPVITWNHNMEPDMLSDSLTKRYKIWRATASSMASVPVDYILLKTLDIDSGTAPVYIDTSIIALGSYFHGTGGQMQYPVRYTVQAIDKYQDSSVRSDFGSAIGLLYCGDACAFGEDNILQNEHSPKKYSLNQNYPNPFNPLTKIKYDLPNDNFVTIKIYDILGKELMNLVNEFKQAGSYSVTFDATNYPSGVYYYKITSDNFVQVRKMILIR